jgi:ABC-2 type transport system ATP-binding protein
MNAIDVSNLTIKYGNFTAVDGISFAVKKSEVYGIIGPNGAGKTSTLECLEGLRPHKGGSLTVLGEDPRHREKLYSKMGVQLQETRFQDNIKVRELLGLHASFYESPSDADGLLSYFDLLDKKDSYVKKLSGGQRQRLAIILALIGDPEILVLDEISAGLDPQARVHIWQKIKELNKKGKTILLTTHLMQEAEELCDRVCLLVAGRIKAEGTLSEIIAQARLEISITAYADAGELKKLRPDDIPEGVKVEVFDDRAELSFADASRISQAMAWICGRIQISDLDLFKPKLEDVFLKLTGARLEDDI